MKIPANRNHRAVWVAHIRAPICQSQLDFLHFTYGNIYMFAWSVKMRGKFRIYLVLL